MTRIIGNHQSVMQSVMQSVSQSVRLLDQNFQEASIDEAARSDEDLITEMSRFLCKTFADNEFPISIFEYEYIPVDTL